MPLDDARRRNPAGMSDGASKSDQSGRARIDKNTKQISQNCKPRRPKPDFASQMAQDQVGRHSRGTSGIYRHYNSRNWEPDFEDRVLEVIRVRPI